GHGDRGERGLPVVHSPWGPTYAAELPGRRWGRSEQGTIVLFPRDQGQSERVIAGECGRAEGGPKGRGVGEPEAGVDLQRPRDDLADLRRHLGPVSPYGERDGTPRRDAGAFRFGEWPCSGEQLVPHEPQLVDIRGGGDRVPSVKLLGRGVRRGV